MLTAALASMRPDVAVDADHSACWLEMFALSNDVQESDTMTMAADDSLIAESVLGADLTGEEVHTLARLMDVKPLEDGEVLVREGDTNHALHLLASGELEVSRRDFGGTDVHLHTMHQGELAGAMGFVDGIPRSATLSAKGPARVYSLEREAFEGLIDGYPRLVYHIMRTVTRTAHGAMLGLNSQVEELTNYIVKQHGRY